jgi:hypothetical protein
MINEDKKIEVFKVTAHGSSLIMLTPEEVCEFMDEEFENLEEFEEIHVEKVSMAESEIRQLPEFKGF